MPRCRLRISARRNPLLNYWRLAYAALPFVTVQVLLLIVLALWPGISLTLPRLLGFSVN